MQLAGYHPATSAVWAGALFASVLQRSGKPSPGQVRKAVAAAIRAYGGCWCAGRVAQESGDHPETAVEQMCWARAQPRRGVHPAAAAQDSGRKRPERRRTSRLTRGTPDVVRTKALARCDSQLQGTPPEGWDLAAQPRAAAEEPARHHGKALAQTGAAYRQEQKMSEATFTDRSVLVTGATRGIGQVIAPEFGRRGGHLLAAGRDRERGENVAGQIRSHGGRADFIPADLRDAASAKDLARRATEVAGQVDILVNNAGIAVFGPTGAASEADFDAVYGSKKRNGVRDDAST